MITNLWEPTEKIDKRVIHRSYVDDPRVQLRKFIKKNLWVRIALGENDDKSRWIDGYVEYVMTPESEQFAENGIKVRIDDGSIGSVKEILEMPQISDYDMRQLIQKGETLKMEFKETFKVSARSGTELKCLRDETVKEIAAFMNTHGGRVLIGVNDSSEIVGLALDYNFTVVRYNQTKQDKLKQEIRSYVKEKLGNIVLESCYNIDIKCMDGKEICVIDVYPSHMPVFVDQKITYQECNTNNQKSAKRGNFYIRTDSGVQLLDPREISEYWKGRQYSYTLERVPWGKYHGRKQIYR